MREKIRLSIFALVIACLSPMGSLRAQSSAGSPNNHTITLSWAAVSNVTGYNVYKAFSACAGATFTKVTPSPVTATAFSETGLPDGVTRCYYVTAVNANGESLPGGKIQITTPMYIAPAAAPPPAPAAPFQTTN